MISQSNTLRQLPSSHPRRPGDLCLPRLPGLYQWMLDGWFYGMDLWMDCWVILNFILWDDWMDLIMWEFQSEYELQCNEVLGWRRRAPTVEGFTKEVKVFSSNCLLASPFMWLRQFFSEMVRAFLNFPGECALRPIHGGDHPEDCAGQVSLAPLHHHVNPQLENSCEATEWLPQSENLCEATRQPYEQSIWAIHQKILGNPGGCSGPVRVNLCSCFAEPYLHHEEAICVKPNPSKLLPINHCCHNMLFFSHCFKSFHQFLSITNLQKTCIARNILWGFQIKTVETEIWGWTLVGFRNCLFAILCWQVAGEPMLFARGSSSWAFVRPIAEYRWGRASVPALLLKTISTMADKCNPTLFSFWR